MLAKLAEHYNMTVSMFYSESDDILSFHSADAFDRFAGRGGRTAGRENDAQSEAETLSSEELLLLAQYRALSCLSDEPVDFQNLLPEEYDDNELLAYLINPDHERKTTDDKE